MLGSLIFDDGGMLHRNSRYGLKSVVILSQAMKVIIVRISVGLKHFDCQFGLFSEIQDIRKLIIGELMTINLAIHSCLPQRRRNMSVDSMQSRNPELMDDKFATNMSNLPQI
jgi:hypothetical protein